MDLIHKTGEKGGYVVLWKKEGETPLRAMEDFFVHNEELWEFKRSYAGRLDPMAEGQLLVIYGDELKNKDIYIGLDKTYEIDVVLGIQTDTGDVLGLIEETDVETGGAEIDPIKTEISKKWVGEKLKSLVGEHNMPYPNFSSKTVRGVALHVLSRQGVRQDVGKGGQRQSTENPHKVVKIFDITLIGQEKIKISDLVNQSIGRIGRVAGDFRQEEIINKWKSLGVAGYAENELFVLKLKVECSSGTYMRWLCLEVGKLFGTKAFCNRIVRTEIKLA